MSKPNDSRRIDYVTPTVLAFVGGYAAIFLGVPFMMMEVRLPFLVQTDNTHLAVLGCIIELPSNIPGLVIAVFYFLLTLLITSVLIMLLTSAWQKLAVWSEVEVDEFCEGKETDSQGTDFAQSMKREEIPCLIEEQAPVSESETLKMPEAKVLQDDLNSL